MTPEEIDYLQCYLTDKLSVCPYTWESFKTTLKDATNNSSEKRQKHNADWFDENDIEIQNVSKDKNLNRREIHKRIRQMKNDWFTRKAKQAETFHLQKNQREFHAMIREIYGPKSKNTHRARSKNGQLLTAPDEIKERWVEIFFQIFSISTKKLMKAFLVSSNNFQLRRNSIIRLQKVDLKKLSIIQNLGRALDRTVYFQKFLFTVVKL